MFNDSTDVDYVGVITELVGLDSAETRESAEDLSQADGGSHGDFWEGRRPIVITGLSYGHDTMLQRELRLDKLRRASRALRTDATLAWQNAPLASYLPMYVPVRRQQKLSIKGNWNKEFQVALVSEYTQLFGATLKNSPSIGATAVVLENQGDYPAYPLLGITNADANTRVINETTGKVLTFTAAHTGLFLITVDTANHTATINGTNQNDRINFQGDWPFLQSGNNSWRIEGAGTFTVQWRDAWG